MKTKVKSKAATIIACIVLTIIFSSTATFANGVVVQGKNDPSVDLDEFRAAVNGGTGPSGTTYPGGGNVVLVGIFDFGGGTAILEEDVSMLGSGAKIRNAGNGAISSYFSEDFDPPVIEIKDLQFEECVTGLFIKYAGGLHVTGCRFIKCQYIGIRVDTSIGGGWWNPEHVSGDVIISNNYLDLNPDNIPEYHWFYQMGVFINGIDAELTISDNEVMNWHWLGIYCRPNKGPTTIADNFVRAGPHTLGPLPSGEWSGICYGWWAWDVNTGGLFTQGDVQISDNKLEDACIWIELIEKPALNTILRVVDNKVTLNDPNWLGLGLVCHSSYWFCADNVFSGVMNSAIYVAPHYSPPDAGLCEYNTFINNNFDDCISITADVIFSEDANHNNIVCGEGTYVNHGIGNEVTEGWTCVGGTPAASLNYD